MTARAFLHSGRYPNPWLSFSPTGVRACGRAYRVAPGLPLVDHVWHAADSGQAFRHDEADRCIPERNTPHANLFLEPSFNFQNCAQWIVTNTFPNGAKMKSIREQLNELTGTRGSNRDSADVLRSLVTLKYGLRATGFPQLHSARSTLIEA